ncbi:MAG TPA: glycosyltransferase family protein [Polyangia bacterium]|jgi:spore coat polysaccharide biosynthesis protein SpsF|nr:glycosyltransferase family protein [Polyangia bacterium]
MRTVIIVQARMTSTRLPGKVLADLAGRPMLAQELARLRRCRRAEEIVVATTTNATDDPVVALAEKEGVRWFRGDEHDVLSRYLGAAREARAEVVVRVTADCPLIEPALVDEVVRALTGEGPAPESADYASNIQRRTFPRGLDAEALYMDVLERVGRLGRTREAREHVTFFIHRERPELFLLRSVTGSEDHSDLRWTVDEPADLELVRRIYELGGLGAREVGFGELVALVRSHPELARLNAHVQQVHA